MDSVESIFRKSVAIFAVQTAVGARALARFNVDLQGHAEAA
jgi:hypothetical protein